MAIDPLLLSSSTITLASSTYLLASSVTLPDPPPEILTEDYLDLITAFHRGKPKFTSMIRSITDPLVADISLLRRLPLVFDLDTAVGAQLDVDGEWIGRSRFIRIPIPNVYFSLDDPVRGFDQGVWRGPYDSDTGVTRLDDETYRTLLRAKIAANHWDGTLSSAKAALDIMFPDGDTKIIMIDNQDMTITLGVSGTLPSLLFIVLLSQGYIPLKPEGVRMEYSIVTEPGPLFGFDVDNQYISGFDESAWGAPPDYFTS